MNNNEIYVILQYCISGRQSILGIFSTDLIAESYLNAYIQQENYDPEGFEIHKYNIDELIYKGL